MAAYGTEKASVDMFVAPPSFSVVGIGASAGGLEAITQLLTHVPATLGMAYVIIQHLNPVHKSLLADLLVRVTPMPVREVTENMLIEANHVYVITPNTDLTIQNDQLILAPQVHTDHPHLSIDMFLRSLAENCQHQAIGIILSGTASDGTLGLKEIKTRGGLTFAQEPMSATNAQMPQNAIRAGWVDWVGTPEAIAGELRRFSRYPLVRRMNSVNEHQEDEATRESAFQQILRLLKQQTHVDFAAYKSAMLKRRIQRRLAVLQLNTMSMYLAYLQGHQAEVAMLSQDMLIGVTSFFRDAQTFQGVSQEVLPRLVATTSPHAPLRVWVPGCSTGEEVYSLTICIVEFLIEHSLTRPVQIFGTDLNGAAIAVARAGLYPERAMSDLPSAYRERYFQPINGSYQISKSIRDLCVFAEHNLLIDPPFSHLDLLSCHNVMIYLESEAQYKLARLFHYALSSHGVLLLGRSETIRFASDLFLPMGERNWSCYLKKASTGRLPFIGPVTGNHRAPRALEEEIIMRESEGTRRVDLEQEVDRLLLARYAPASVVIDTQMDILYVRGHTSPYLEAAPGRASLNLFKMVREGLGLEIRTAISKARKSGQPVRKEGVPVDEQGVLRQVAVEVVPVTVSPLESYFVILFEEMNGSRVLQLNQPTLDKKATRITQRGIKDKRIQQLEQELALTRQELRSIIEELEAANEELQSANEESLSHNEELQSVNEELETSKEEIQSTNEELLVINQELMLRNIQVQAARTFAEAIVETIREPLLVLNSDLRVQQANEAFYQCFQMKPSEVEQQLLFTLGQGEWNISALRSLLEELLPTRKILTDYEVEQTFSRTGHKILLLNAQRIDDQPLLLLAIEDITLQRLAQENEQRLLILKQREEFLAIASHELKTPVTSIKGYTQILHRRFQKVGDESSTTLVARMDTQLNRLIHLIMELLDTTKIEEGKLQWHRQPFDLTELIHETIVELGYIEQTHQIQFKGSIHRSLSGDRERISQVLTNLMSNAMKYSPGASLIEVRLQETSEAAIVSVQDFGIGIAQEKHEQIFERFFRVNDPGHTTFSGLGLGLYISAEIVKAHGGRMWVESQSGTGSTFFFTLPFVYPDPKQEA